MKKKSKQNKIQYKFDYLSLILIIFSIIALYAQSVSFPFQFDDLRFIMRNDVIQDGSVTDIFQTYKLRFIPFLSFSINYLINELNTSGYRIINILIHIFNSILVYYLVKIFFDTPVFKDKYKTNYRNYLPIVIALLFALHPVQTQAVVYIYQRMAAMVALFYLLSVFSFIKYKLSESKQNKNKYLILMFISLVFGAFTKENFFTIPFVLYITNLVFFKEKFKFNWILLILIVIPVVFSLYIIINPEVLFNLGYTGHYYTGELISPLKYLFSQFVVLLKYLQLLMIPYSQNLDYDFTLYNSIFNLNVILSFIFHIILISYSIFMFKKSRIVTFGIFWFYLTIAVESSVIPIQDLIFEHRLYLPLIGFFISLFASILYFQKNKINITTKIFSGIYILILFILAFFRIQDWESEKTLWMDVAEKSPEKIRPFNNLGYLYFLEKNYPKSIENYSKAIENSKKYVENYSKAPEWFVNDAVNIYKNRGLVFYYKKQYLKAIDDYNVYEKFNYSDQSIYMDRGNAYKRIENYQKAIQDYSKFLSEKSENFKLYHLIYQSRGICYVKLKNYNKAILDFTEAIKISDDNYDFYNLRAFCYYKLEKWDKAISDYKKALQINPNSEEAIKNIKIIKALKGQKKE